MAYPSIDAELDNLGFKINNMVYITKDILGIDKLILEFDLDSSTDLLVGLLSFTFIVKDKLKNRAKFFEKVEAEIKRRGHWEPNLLLGLE